MIEREGATHRPTHAKHTHEKAYNDGVWGRVEPPWAPWGGRPAEDATSSLVAATRVASIGRRERPAEAAGPAAITAAAGPRWRPWLVPRVPPAAASAAAAAPAAAARLAGLGATGRAVPRGAEPRPGRSPA